MEVENDISVAQDIPVMNSLVEDERNILLLQLQTEILDNIAAIQESVRNAVINREWTDFESLLSRMNQYGDRFQALEAERVALFAGFLETEGVSEQKYVENKNSSFYTMVSRLPENERQYITELYRNLKLRILKVRMANESLVTYLNEAKTTVDGFIDAVYPDRKTRFYSRRGAKVMTDVRSMVVNQSL